MAKSHYDQTSNVSDFSFYFYILNTIKFPYTYEKKYIAYYVLTVVGRLNFEWLSTFFYKICV